MTSQSWHLKIRRIFNFELEQKGDHHSSAEFHSESNGDSFEALKSIIDLLIGHNWPQLPNSQLRAETKIRPAIRVRFLGDSNDDTPKVNEQISVPLIGLN